MNTDQIVNQSKDYSIQVLNINGVEDKAISQKAYQVEDICKGGFRFITSRSFELEDRLKVLLSFPDSRTQEVLGRICYSDIIDEKRSVYGFSIIDGFYSLKNKKPLIN